MAFTFFFRDLQTLQNAVTETLDISQGRQRIFVWDAGCAMGPEPYTLAILFAEAMGTFAYKRLHIDATDYDAESGTFGDTVNRAVYPEEQIKRIPKDLFKQYFRQNNDGNYQIVEKIRSHVHFRQHDLTTCTPFRQGYILIVCKNVLLHFSSAMRASVVKMFYNVLVPGGILAMEQTQDMPYKMMPFFERISSQDKLYRKKPFL